MTLFAPPVREFDGRRTMRTLADALDKLRELEALSDCQWAEIRTFPIELFDGIRTGTVGVLGHCKRDGSPAVILMPSSGSFTATGKDGARLVFPIGLLHEAVTDAAGNVTLKNRNSLRHVELRPVPFSREFTQLEHKIVRHAVTFLQANCYRALDNELLPGITVLDYTKVPTVSVRRLKPLIRYVVEHLSASVSDQFIARTLRRAGMHLPRSRRKAPSTV